jgi:hypothetical protein
MPIKSFRGMIEDLKYVTLNLHTKDGSTGYRITKFSIMPKQPFEKDQESVVKIYKVEPTTVDETVDFSDPTLVGAGICTNEYNSTDANGYMHPVEVIFDNEIFNQDIYVTHRDNGNAEFINYYIELEQVRLDLSQNTVATLKDIRNIKSQ